jgi:O-antigen/teichoic acid export membrane protein
MSPLGAARARVLALFQHGVVRSIGVLAGGTFAAHAITALAMPISTRLYSPEDFTVVSVFAAVVGILAVAVSLRMDLAVALPESEEDAAALLVMSVIFAAATSGLLALVGSLVPRAAYEVLNLPGLLPYLWLIPPAVFITSVYVSLQMWFVRQKRFGPIARSRAGQATAAAVGQIGLGAMGVAPLGLIVGNALNSGAGAVTLGLGFLLRDRGLLAGLKFSRLKALFRTYDRFPKFSVAEALANAAAIHAPMLVIAALQIGPEAGYLTLALFLLQAPMALLGNAVGQVFLSGAPEAEREGRLTSFTVDVFTNLLRTGMGPLLFAAIVSPFAFGLVFGSDWVRAGVLVAWLAPWFLLQFVTVPIATSLHVIGRQRLAMVLQTTGLIVRLGAVVAAGFLARPWIAEVYAVSGFVFYALCLVAVLRAVGAPAGALPTALRRSAAPAAAFGMLGAVVALTLVWAGVA